MKLPHSIIKGFLMRTSQLHNLKTKFIELRCLLRYTEEKKIILNIFKKIILRPQTLLRRPKKKRIKNKLTIKNSFMNKAMAVY